jgi:hypothetical protein
MMNWVVAMKGDVYDYLGIRHGVWYWISTGTYTQYRFVPDSISLEPSLY